MDGWVGRWMVGCVGMFGRMCVSNFLSTLSRMMSLRGLVTDC